MQEIQLLQQINITTTDLLVYLPFQYKIIWRVGSVGRASVYCARGRRIKNSGDTNSNTQGLLNDWGESATFNL